MHEPLATLRMTQFIPREFAKPLARGRVAFFRVDAEIANGFLQEFRADGVGAICFVERFVVGLFTALLVCQSMERSKHNMLCVHFKEIAQRRAIFAATETV